MANHDKIKTIIFSALIPTVAVIILIAGIVVVFNFVSKMGGTEIARKTQHYAQLADYTEKNATVFFGDSITELCKTDSLYCEYTAKTGTPVINRGISAECTDSMLERLDESIISIEPKNLVMLMGVNDLNQGVSPDKITDNIREIIIRVKEKSPDTNIILQAVYPINSNRDSLYERIQLKGRENSAIKALNEKLKELAEQEKITFLDVTDLLSDENGDLREEYTFDGLHPNVDGYLAVKDRIISVLK